jgi:hypothetical protein
MTTLRFRTECNKRSKYFDDIAGAFKHFYRCIAERKSVEIWLVAATERQGSKSRSVLQELLDLAEFI